MVGSAYLALLLEVGGLGLGGLLRSLLLLQNRLGDGNVVVGGDARSSSTAILAIFLYVLSYEERAIVLVVSRLVGCRGSWREAKFEVPSKIAALC
jgi:hypothetical protein